MSIQDAANAIRRASALLIGAGAGMGVDSGLPDFRGKEGFWKAYPALQGRSFASVSTPTWFHEDPQFAWGFFGHRFHLYKSKTPHAGFEILRRWSERMAMGSFVVTSNVDGHFQKAGFPADECFEIHGRINLLQCCTPCCSELFSTDHLELDIDEANVRCRSELPRCPNCDDVARPNILMFGDSSWIDDLSQVQSRVYENWLKQVDHNRLVVVEIGAGTAIASIRYECESRGGTLIRINPREADGPPGTISIAMKGLEALQAIDALL